MALLKKKTSDKENLMLQVPEIKHKDYIIKDGRIYMSFRHNKPVERLLQSVFKRPAITDIELDEIGTKVWLSMNGNNTVYDIGHIISSEFNQELQDVYKRLALYIKYMIYRGWIVMKKNTH